MARETRSLSCSVQVVGILIAIFYSTTLGIGAAGQTAPLFGKESTNFHLRDSAIKEALVAISTGKLPPNDDQLIGLITENVKEVAIRSANPTAGIEAAGRQAQEAVSEVAAAYTAIIFQSSSVKEAQRLFNRYQNTVDKIVEFAKSGNFIGRNRAAPESTNI